MTDVNYMFSAEPRPVQVAERKQPKYRESVHHHNTARYCPPASASSTARSIKEADTALLFSLSATRTYSPVNIMYDKRVVRGPTFRSKLDLSATVTPITPQHKPTTKPAYSQQQQQQQQKPLGSPKHLTTLTSPHYGPSGTNPPLTHSALVQTDDYLEELADEVYESEGSTQTDGAYLPAVETAAVGSVLSLPLFVPKTAGVDAGTAIEALELFDYDVAVLPLLSTLVGKAMEQAEVEVREEEEMARLEAQRATYERGRQLMVAEVSRLEVEEERRVKEKAKRFEAERERLVREQHMREKRRAMELADQARRQLEEAERQ